VEQRSVDLVIVSSRFISHSESECVLDAAKAADVPWLPSTPAVESRPSGWNVTLSPSSLYTPSRNTA